MLVFAAAATGLGVRCDNQCGIDEAMQSLPLFIAQHQC